MHEKHRLSTVTAHRIRAELLEEDVRQNELLAQSLLDQICETQPNFPYREKIIRNIHCYKHTVWDITEPLTTYPQVMKGKIDNEIIDGQLRIARNVVEQMEGFVDASLRIHLANVPQPL